MLARPRFAAQLVTALAITGAGCFLDSIGEGQPDDPTSGGNGGGIVTTGGGGSAGSTTDGGAGGAAGGGNEGGGGGSPCGNGALDGGEQCDTGTRTSAGCVDCITTQDWSCVGEPSQCTLAITTADNGNIPLNAQTGYDGSQITMDCRSLAIAAPATTTLAALRVRVAIQHDNASDIVLKLWPPGSSGNDLAAAITLVSRPGVSEPSDSYFNAGVAYSDLIAAFPITFDDGAADSAETMGAALATSSGICQDAPNICAYRSHPGATLGLALSDLADDQLDPSGTWTFCAADADDVGVGGGTLTLVELTVVVE